MSQGFVCLQLRLLKHLQQGAAFLLLFHGVGEQGNTSMDMRIKRRGDYVVELLRCGDFLTSSCILFNSKSWSFTRATLCDPLIVLSVKSIAINRIFCWYCGSLAWCLCCSLGTAPQGAEDAVTPAPTRRCGRGNAGPGAVSAVTPGRDEPGAVSAVTPGRALWVR